LRIWRSDQPGFSVLFFRIAACSILAPADRPLASDQTVNINADSGGNTKLNVNTVGDATTVNQRYALFLTTEGVSVNMSGDFGTVSQTGDYTTWMHHAGVRSYDGVNWHDTWNLQNY
jgi:hypothetical protein